MLGIFHTRYLTSGEYSSFEIITHIGYVKNIEYSNVQYLGTLNIKSHAANIVEITFKTWDIQSFTISRD